MEASKEENAACGQFWIGSGAGGLQYTRPRLGERLRAAWSRAFHASLSQARCVDASHSTDDPKHVFLVRRKPHALRVVAKGIQRLQARQRAVV